MTRQKTSILRQAAFRLFLSLGLFVLLVGVSTALIYRAALSKAAHERASDLQEFYSTRLSQLEREWEVGSRDVRVRLEYTRILEHTENATDNLQAYLTIQGGGRRYAYLVIQNRERDVLFSFGKEKEAVVAAIRAGKVEGDWFYDALSHSLYRVFTEQIWLGEAGTGRAVFFYSIDNALLLQMTMPGTLLSVLYQDRRVASSQGMSGLDENGIDLVGDYETRLLPWSSALNDPVKLSIQSPVKGLFTITQLAGGVSAIPLLDALILWFTLGTWLIFNARRIKALGEAVREFSIQQELTPDLSSQIDLAKQGKLDEINEVASAMEAMALETERRERERHAEETQRRLWALVFEGSNDAIVITSSDHRVVAVNAAFERSMGYSESEVVGHNPHELMASGQHDLDFYRAMWHQIAERGYWQGEIWDRRKDGEIYPKQLSISAIYDHAGMPMHYVGIYTDITERKRSEAGLQQYREHLEALVKERTHALEGAQQELVKSERLATLGQITATVSHELRNPLATMRPSLYVLKRKMPENDEKVLQAIERIDRNITRCDHIIDELLDFTRSRDLVRVEVDFDVWVESILAELNKPEDVQLRFDPGLPGCKRAIDPESMRRVLVNVHDNACHALQERQKTGEAGYQPRLAVSTRSTGGGRFELVFADNGPGMTDEVLGRIFEPLFSTRGFGVGLGMSVVQKIMVQHGGGVRVESHVGEGTRVTLWLKET